MPNLSKLVDEAKLGDEDAIAELVAEFSNSIEQECAKYGIWQHPDWSHSDLMQEVLIRVWTNLDQFKGGDEKLHIVFDHWLRKTARSVLANLHRFRNAKKRMPVNGLKPFDELTQAFVRIANHERTASSIFANDEEALKIRETMERCLSQRSQQIINLRIVEGLSLAEISERLCLKYEQVRYDFRSSVVKLQKRLSET